MNEEMKQHPVYTNYTIGRYGLIYRDGKPFRTDIFDKDVYINGSFITVDELVRSVWVASPVSSITNKVRKQYPKGNKHEGYGRKLSEETKNKIALSKRKPITIEGVEYSSLNDAARILNVNRSTLYRRYSHDHK